MIEYIVLHIGKHAQFIRVYVYSSDIVSHFTGMTTWEPPVWSGPLGPKIWIINLTLNKKVKVGMVTSSCKYLSACTVSSKPTHPFKKLWLGQTNKYTANSLTSAVCKIGYCTVFHSHFQGDFDRSLFPHQSKLFTWTIVKARRRLTFDSPLVIGWWFWSVWLHIAQLCLHVCWVACDTRLYTVFLYLGN